jgi:hypothetical protein
MISFPLFFSTKYKQIKKFFKKVPTQNETFKEITIEPIESFSYIDPNLSLETKIEQEQRRRYQAYATLDYLLSVVSYFDFFSKDSFIIAKKAKELSQIFNKKSITSDLLLLPFFESNSQIKILLEKHGIQEQEVGEIISSANKIPNQSVRVKTVNWVKNLFIRIDIPMLAERLIIPTETKYSYEIHQIFEKAAENAVLRFKTPVISSEILLITMLEAKKSKAGKLLKQLLGTESNWYMFRYSLMKRLHSQELAIRTDVPKNQQYFAYLLKTQLSESEFDMLMEKDCLLPGILLFRNHMVADLLQVDLQEHIKMDILGSIKSRSKKRTYASLLRDSEESRNLETGEESGNLKSLNIMKKVFSNTSNRVNEDASLFESSAFLADKKQFQKESGAEKNEQVLSETGQKMVGWLQNPELRTKLVTNMTSVLKRPTSK